MKPFEIEAKLFETAFILAITSFVVNFLNSTLGKYLIVFVLGIVFSALLIEISER